MPRPSRGGKRVSDVSCMQGGVLLLTVIIVVLMAGAALQGRAAMSGAGKSRLLLGVTSKIAKHDGSDDRPPGAKGDQAPAVWQLKAAGVETPDDFFQRWQSEESKKGGGGEGSAGDSAERKCGAGYEKSPKDCKLGQDKACTCIEEGGAAQKGDREPQQTGPSKAGGGGGEGAGEDGGVVSASAPPSPISAAPALPSPQSTDSKDVLLKRVTAAAAAASDVEGRLLNEAAANLNDTPASAADTAPPDTAQQPAPDAAPDPSAVDASSTALAQQLSITQAELKLGIIDGSLPTTAAPSLDDPATVEPASQTSDSQESPSYSMGPSAVGKPSSSPSSHFQCHHKLRYTKNLDVLQVLLRPPQAVVTPGEYDNAAKGITPPPKPKNGAGPPTTAKSRHRHLLSSSTSDSESIFSNRLASKSPALYKPLNQLSCERFTTDADLPIDRCDQDAFAPYAMDLALDVTAVAGVPLEPHCNGLGFTRVNDDDGAVDVSLCPGTVSYGKAWDRDKHTRGTGNKTPELHLNAAGNSDIPGVRYLWTTCSIEGVGCFENFQMRAVAVVKPTRHLLAIPSEPVEPPPEADQPEPPEPAPQPTSLPLTPRVNNGSEPVDSAQYMVVRAHEGQYLTGYGGPGRDWLSLTSGNGPCGGVPDAVCDDIVFESIPTPDPSRVRLKCTKNGKFLKFGQPDEANAWVFRCSGDGSATDDPMTGVGDGQDGLFRVTTTPDSRGNHFISVTTHDNKQAHVNVVKSIHVRGHGNAPFGNQPAGQEPTAALKIKWVTKSQIEAGNRAQEAKEDKQPGDFQNEKGPGNTVKAEPLSVLYLIFDSLSSRKFDQYFPITSKTLSESPALSARAKVFSFKRTSIFGRNTAPNMPPMFGEWDVKYEDSKQRPKLKFPNVFDAWKRSGSVPSFFKDTCKDEFCTTFNFKEHKICSKLGCHYGADVDNIFARNPNPGCIHGRWWSENHRDYIRSFWDVYPGQSKFHVSVTWGGHSNYALVPVQHDAVINKLILEMVKKHPNTIIFLGSDHGYHYGIQQGFNNFIPGEHQHRNPVLKAIIPKHMFIAEKNKPAKFDADVIASNEMKMVSHLDMHATLLDLAENTATNKGPASSPVAYNLLQERIPSTRTCAQATIPRRWCPCFREKRAGVTECTVNPWNGCANMTAKQIGRFQELKDSIASQKFKYDVFPEFSADIDKN